MAAAESIPARLRRWARALAQDAHALWLAARDPATPWYARWLAIAIAAYALSPIDLIPDFIPILGYLDDLILLPLGIWLALRLIPEDVMARHRAAARAAARRPRSRLAAVTIVLLWISGMLLFAWWLFGMATEGRAG